MIPPTDEDAAFNKLEEAIAIKPDEAIYRRLVALMLLRRGDAPRASEHLRQALDCVQSLSELAQGHLLLGFANDLLDTRDQAVDCYREALKIAAGTEDGILASVSRFIIVDAEKYSRVPFTLENAKKLEVSIEITGRYDL
jgi:tetratricopeptide (TPR) repeat protein